MNKSLGFMAEESSIARDVNCLLDPSVSIRKAALYRLQQRLDSPDLHNELGSDALIKALLRRFADSSEKCRCLAISLLISLLQVAHGHVVALMPYILPVISERLPLKSLPNEADSISKESFEEVQVEPSEEVRLLLVQLLNALLEHAPRLIQPFASDVASIIMVTARDPYPEVLTETMSLLERFTFIMEQKLKPIAKQLVSVVLRLLVHNRYKIRVAALRAIHKLVIAGAHESIYDLTAFKDPNLIPIRAFYHPYVKTQYLALLATDKSVAVRKELLLTVASWLMKLEERKQHEVRLIPYVISGFNDSDVEVQDLAFRLMEEIGQQYEKENETEVKDVKQYFWEATENITIGGEPLPSVFKHRPCLGARILVRSCFSMLLHAIDADIQAWTSGTKELSAKFLYTMLIFVEENVTMHLEPLCYLLMKACCDTSIEKTILDCAKVVGYFVNPSAYLAIMLPHIRGEVSGNVTIQHAGRTLKVLSRLMVGTRPLLLREHVPEICSSLTEQDLITSIDKDVNQGIVGSCKAMVGALDDNCEETLSLLWLILNAIAAAEFIGQPSANAESVLKDLAKGNKYNSSEELLAEYMEDVLSVLPEPKHWIMRSLQPLVYCRLLKAGFQTHGEALDKLFLPLRSGAVTLDDKIVSRILSTLQGLIEGRSINHSELYARVQTVMEEFVKPCEMATDL